MRISGFTMVKNATKLYYPIKQSIASVLDIVDEFVVALGDCDADDRTREEILSLNSPKVKIIDTVWDLKKYPNGMENAHQTDIAKNACTGDWLIYLQADEVIHEKYHQTIYSNCKKYLNDKRVDGFLFKYVHFWGDYWHYHNVHGWYKNDIRIIRNDAEIHSYQSAQSFRRIPDFDGLNYRQKENTFKLNVVPIDAEIYHYGWVRPPQYMQSKKKALDTIHKGKERVEEMYKADKDYFDYGPLGNLPEFKDSHPKVMQDWIANFDWKDKLNYGKNLPTNRPLLKHEKFKYRLITWIEKYLLGGKEIFGYSNWNIIKS